MPYETHFNHHYVECHNCGHHSKGATKLVAQQRDREHAIKCDAKIKKDADAKAADRAQGKLF